MPLSKQALVVKNNTNFPNNNSGYITPALLREFNTDMIDAMQLTQSMSEYAVLSGSNTFIGNQTITGNLNVNGVISASVLYVQTETASVIYSSGSNQFGDELTDIQTLSGSVKIQGSLTVNGVPVVTGSVSVNTGSLVTTASFNAYTQSTNLRLTSLETNSASVNVSISNLNQTTASLSNSITNINSFTQSQAALNGTFATTGSNTFTGNQVIDRAYKLFTNGVYWTDMTAGFNNLEIINQGGGNLDFASLNGGRMRVVNTPLQLTGSVLSSNSDISTSANVYGANLTGTISSSAQISALGFVSSSITASSLITASLSGQTLTFTKGNGTTFGIVIPDVSGSDITALNAFTASQLTINTGYNTFTQSANVSISALNSATASYVTETESGSFLLTASFDNGNRNLTFTKGDNTTFAVNIPDVSGSAGDFVTTASFNAYTQSNDQRVSSLETNSASVNISINNINTTTASLNTSVTNLNASSASQQISIDNLNTNSASVNTSITNINSATASLFTSASLALVTASFSGNTLTFTKGDASTFGVVIPDVSGSTINTGSFATTGSNSFTGSQFITGGVVITGYTQTGPNQYSLETSDSIRVNKTISTSGFNLSGSALTEALNSFYPQTLWQHAGIVRFTNQIGGVGSGSIFITADGGAALNLSGSQTNIAGVDFIPFSASVNSRLTGFATTGSNTFTGDQTLIDNAGNFFTISDASGSMMLVAKGFTSASLHLSASSAGIGNFIFKTNSNTPDTIISGSGNIFVNGAAPTAGFKRYIGGSNNIFNTTGLPQISGSMTFSPTMTGNIGTGTYTFRGPVSSSAWNISNNLNNGTVLIGQTAANNAEKLVSGLTMTTNVIPGTVSIVANGAALTGSMTFVSNFVAGGATITAASSSVSMVNNIINDPTFVLTNNHFSSSVGLGSVTVSRNNIGGQANSVIVVGSQPAGTTNGTSYSDNFIGGGSNTLFGDVANSRVVGANAYHSAVRNMIFGNNLIVSASSLLTDPSSHGSAFFGRFNSLNGNADMTAETIFAVGTGTSTTTRKTGFLIDSGSNTFVEGTLNVSGATTLNGNLIVTGSVIGGNNLITTGSATSASQTILGDFKFDTSYIANNPYVSGVGGAQTIEVSYGDIFNGTQSGNDFILWLDTNFAGVTVSGTGITNGNITGYGFSGNGAEIYITAGTITNGATYIFTGPAIQTIDITGSLQVTKAIRVSSNNSTSDVANNQITNVNNTFSAGMQAGAINVQTIDGTDRIYMNISSSVFGAGAEWPGAQFSTVYNGAETSLIGFQTQNTWTDGRVSIITPLEALSGSYISNNSAFPQATGSALVAWNASTGKLTHTTYQSALPALFDVGAFYSTITQSGSANVSGSFRFDNTIPINSISVSGSNITIPKAGYYNFQFSIQLVQGSGAADVAVWLKRNGGNVANTATYVTVPSNHKNVLALNLWDSGSVGDVYQLAYQSDSNNTTYQYIAPTGNIPGSPSVIMTVNQVR